MKRAFTLVEVLISSVIVMVIIVGIIAIANVGNKEWSTEVGLLGLHQQARQAMHGMVRETRQSQYTDIIISSNGEIIEFKIPQDFFSGSTSLSTLISVTRQCVNFCAKSLMSAISI